MATSSSIFHPNCLIEKGTNKRSFHATQPTLVQLHSLTHAHSHTQTNEACIAEKLSGAEASEKQ